MTAREAMVHPWMLRHIGGRCRREGGVVVVATDGNDAGLEDDEGLERSISVHAALRS